MKPVLCRNVRWKATGGHAGMGASMKWRRTHRDCSGFALKPEKVVGPGDNREFVVPDSVEEPEPLEKPHPSSLPFSPNYNESELPISEMEPSDRRRKILTEIINAGAAFEDKIAQYNTYLDEELLHIFHRRIQTTAEFGEESEVEGLVAIWRRLRAEIERRDCSPEMKLLDDLLTIVMPMEDCDDTDDEFERYSDASEHMMSAFLGPLKAHADIFAVARDLAEGKEPPDELTRAPVSRQNFIKEVKELMDDAKKSTIEVKKRLQLINRQTRDRNTKEERKQALYDEADELRKKIDQRESSMVQVDNLLKIAVSMSHIPT